MATIDISRSLVRLRLPGYLFFALLFYTRRRRRATVWYSALDEGFVDGVREITKQNPDVLSVVAAGRATKHFAHTCMVEA
jgi:hypothetical protein